MRRLEARRIKRKLTATEGAKVHQNQRRIASELDDLTARNQMRKEASDEATLSGELRRAIVANPLSLGEIAALVGIAPLALDEFLTGERTLRSDVLDRLAGSLALSPRS